jgi:hypothetical protein
MKVRIVKIYEDQNDPAFIFIEADIFKSKHQPIPDERIINRLQKKDAYAKSSPAKTLKNNNLIIPIEQDEMIIDENIDLSDLGVFNYSYLYFYMLIQNFFSRLL